MNVIKYSLCLKIRSTNTVVKTELTFPALRNTGTKLGSFFFLNEVLFLRSFTKLRFSYTVTPKTQSFRNNMSMLQFFIPMKISKQM